MQVVIMADGQVTRGNDIVKPNVKKVRRLNDAVIGGFAGTQCDVRCSCHILGNVLSDHLAMLACHIYGSELAHKLNH